MVETNTAFTPILKHVLWLSCLKKIDCFLHKKKVPFLIFIELNSVNYTFFCCEWDITI